MAYFSGQGKLFVAKSINGVVQGGYRWVGNVPDFKPTFENTNLEHKESFSGSRLLDKVITTEVKAKISATLEDWSKENLALAVRGATQTVASGSVAVGTPEVFPSGLKAGDLFPLKYQNVSAVVIKDSAGTPATLAATTNYTVDASTGMVTIVDPGTFVQPFKASYTYAAGESTPFFSTAANEVSVRFEGVNTANNNQKVIAEIYRVALDPTKELGLISSDLASFVLEGNALIDPTKPSGDAVFGQFGRLILL